MYRYKSLATIYPIESNKEKWPFLIYGFINHLTVLGDTAVDNFDPAKTYSPCSSVVQRSWESCSINATSYSSTCLGKITKLMLHEILYLKLKLIRFDNLYLYIFQTFLALVVLATCWSYGLAWIVSAGEAQISKVTGFVQYIPDSFLFWMRFYHLFGLLWIAQFVIACQHMIIAGAVAGWYFSRY